jgi:hypothetical protein
MPQGTSSKEIYITSKRGQWPGDLAPRIALADWLTPDPSVERAYRTILTAARQSGSELWPTIGKFTEACVATTISVGADPHSQFDYWQFPGELLSTGIGDCEDHALLLARMLLYSTDVPVSVQVVLGRLKYGHEEGFHAWVEANTSDGNSMILDSTMCLFQGSESLEYTPMLRFNHQECSTVGSTSVAEVIAQSFAFRIRLPKFDPLKEIREKIQVAFDHEAFKLAAKWKEDQPAGSDQDYEDCVTVVATGLTVAGGGIGAAIGGPIGAGIGAGLGAASGIPAARMACRRTIG